MIIIESSLEGTERISLDEEWVSLIRIAKQIGLTAEEVHQFLQGGSVPGKADFQN